MIIKQNPHLAGAAEAARALPDARDVELLTGEQPWTGEGVYAVALRLCAQPRDGTGGDERFVPPALWSEYAQALDGPRPACGPLPPALAGRLFDAASGIASCALLPLRGCGWDGLLAIGARDAERYGAGLGTLFLQRIAELVAHTLDVFLDRCPDTGADADPDARTGDA